jgi:polar amino acid transport system substrate-binding protein
MAVLALLFVASLVLAAGTARAQSGPAATRAASEGDRRAALRVLTADDFPPFNYRDEDGALTGFNVDLANAICLELAATCRVEAAKWEDLLPGLLRRRGDVVMASHAITPRLLASFAVSDRYFHAVGRFAVRKGTPHSTVTPEGLEGKRIAVARGTAHEAYLRTFFRESAVQLFDSVELARDALVAGRVELLFDDGVGLAFWLGGTLSKACCELSGGAFTAPRFFGDGMAVVMPKNDHELERQINGALVRVRQSGRFEELLQKHFPVRVH